MSAVTFSATYVGDSRVVMADEFSYRAAVKNAGKKWGVGACLQGRLEPEEEAQTAGQRKYYFGFIVKPLSEWNGNFADEWHEFLKGMFMPEGKTSLKQLNYEETRDFALQCEVYAHTAHPEAFALYDRRTA